jgi:hypothetical protein
LVFAAALYLVFRALVLHSNFDVVCLPNYELYMGNIAHIADEGWRGAPLHQYYDNCGGHLVTGILAVPLFQLFGESYLALKLVPVLLGLGTLVLIWNVLARWFDPRAAALAVFLFALAPPTLTKYSMLAKGNHFENLFFQLACVWIFLRIHDSARKTGWILAFGATAGFAVFFYFGSLVMVALLALTHLFVRGIKRGLLDYAIALPAFAAGISPLVWVQLHSASRPGGFLEAKFFDSPPRLGGFLGRIGRFLTDYLPRAGVFEDVGPLPARIAEAVFLGAFLVAWLTVVVELVRSLRETRHTDRGGMPAEDARFQALRYLPFVLYLPIVTLVVGTSTFEFKEYQPPVEVGQFRYLVPHFTFATMLLGIAVTIHWRSSARARKVVGAALAAAALSTCAFTLPIVDWSFARPGLGAAYDGYLLRYYANVVLRDTWADPTTGRRTWDHARVTRQLGEFDAIERHELWFSVGHHAASAQTMDIKAAKTPPALDLAAICAPYPADSHADLARGAGSCLRELAERGPAERNVVTTALARLVETDDPLAGWVVEGMCLNFEFPLARVTEKQVGKSAALEPLLPVELRAAWRRGQGIECGRLIARGIPSDLAVVRGVAAGIREEDREEFWLGVGIGLARDGATGGPSGVLEKEIPAERRAIVSTGFGAGMRHGLGSDACARLLDAWKATREEAELRALERGMLWPEYPRPLEL